MDQSRSEKSIMKSSSARRSSSRKEVSTRLHVRDLAIDPDQHFVKYHFPVDPKFPYKLDKDVLHVSIPKGQSVLCETGAMMYMDAGLSPSLVKGQKKNWFIGDVDYYKLKYTNEGGKDAKIAFAPGRPATVIPVSLLEHPDLILGEGAFLAASDSALRIDTERVKSLGAAIGGQGLFVHPLKGKGLVFLKASGTIMYRQLSKGEELIASSGSVVAFDGTCKYGMVQVGGGFRMAVAGGEGLYNTRLVGPGLVILSSVSNNYIEQAARQVVAAGR